MGFKKFIPQANSKIISFFILGIIILINLIGINHFFRIDLTKEKRYTISHSTKSILKELDDFVTIKVFFSHKLPPEFIAVDKQVKDILDEYKAYSKGNIKVFYVNPSKNEKIKNEILSLGIPEIQMNILEKDKFQVQNGFLGVAVFYEDKKEIIPVIENTSTFEYDLTSIIKKLTADKIKKVGFLTGHKEHILERQAFVSVPAEAERANYSTLKKLLEKNYKVTRVNFSQGNTLDDIDTLVIAGPLEKIPEEDLFKIDQFIMGGGKTIFLVDTVTLKGNLSAEKIDTGLKGFLKNFGITLIPKIVLDVSNSNASFSSGFVTFISPYPYWVKVVRNNLKKENPAISNIESLTFPWSSPLQIKSGSGYEVQALASTTNRAWTSDEPFNLNPQQEFHPASQEQFVLAAISKGKFKSFFAEKKNPQNKKTEFSLATEKETNKVLIETEKENYIFVAGDSDFVSDEFVSRDPYNLTFFLNIVDFLTQGSDLISIRSKRVFARPLKEISENGKIFIKGINIIGISFLVVAFGLLRAYMRRKRKKDLII